MSRFLLFLVVVVGTINLTWAQSKSVVENDNLTLKSLPELNLDDKLIVATLEDYLTNRPSGDSSATLGQLYLHLGESYTMLKKSRSAMRALNVSLDILTRQDSIPLFLVSRVEYYKALNYRDLQRFAMAAKWIKKSIQTGENSLAIDSTLLTEKWLNTYRIMAANIANYNFDYKLSEFYISTISSQGAYERKGKTPNFAQRQITAVRAQRELRKKNYEEGIKKLLNLKEIYSDNPNIVLKIESNLATIYLFSERVELAKAMNESAFETHRSFLEQGDSSEMNDFLLLYSQKIQILTDLEEYDQVTNVLREGVEFARMYNKSRVNYHVGNLYSNAVFAARMKGDVQEAEDYLDSSIVHFVNDPRPIDETGMVRVNGNIIYNHDRFLTCLLHQQKIHMLAYEQGNLDRLRLAVRCHTSIDSLIRLSRDQVSLISDVGIAVEKSRRHYNYSMIAALKLYAETGVQKDLANAWKIIAVQKSNLLSRYLNGATLADALSVPREIIDRKTDLELQLSQLEGEAEVATGEELQSKVESVLAINDEVRKINENLALNYPKLDDALRGKVKLDFDAIIRDIPADVAVLEYFIGTDSIYVYALHRKGIEVHTLKPITDLEEKATQAATDTTLAASLYDSLLLDVLTALPSSINRLQIIPDADLWNLPFAALRHNNRFLIRDYAISYAYSAGLLFDERIRKEVASTRTRFAGFGLSYDAILKKIQTSGTRSSTDRNLLSLAGLPYAKDEVVTIGRLTQGDTWLDEAATKEQFLVSIPDYQQLHLAMHGLTDPGNPMENALVFAANDSLEKYDLLTTREILAQKIPARLAVLSACHTGAGPLESSEGIQSMARAFTFSGVKATLASRWEASDKVTHDILIRFYQELEKGESLDRAQQIATVAYLDEASPADQRPELWANLALTGFTQPIHGGSNWLLYGLGAVLFGLLGYLSRRIMR